MTITVAENANQPPPEPAEQATITPLQQAVSCRFAGDEVVRDGEPVIRKCNGCGGKNLKVFYCTHSAREPEEVTAADCRDCRYRPKDPRARTRVLMLKNGLCPGDVLCMTAAVYSLHKQYPGQYTTAVDTTCPAVWEHNPDVVPDFTGRAELIEMEYPLINQSNQRAVHVLQGYCDFLSEKLGVHVPLRTNKPLVYVSNREKTWMGKVQEEIGKAHDYWVVNAGVKEDATAKQYPFYQEVVDRLQGKVLFVQVGKTEHIHKPLRGVLDLLGKTDDRQLIRLIYHASGVLSGVTFTHHLAAAMEKPAVVLAGGREPRSWNQYPLSTIFSTVGALPCCRTEACWRGKVLKPEGPHGGSFCENPCFMDPPASKCMAMIPPEEVAAAVLRYSGR